MLLSRSVVGRRSSAVGGRWSVVGGQTSPSEMIDRAEVRAFRGDGGETERTCEIGDHGDSVGAVSDGEAGIDLIRTQPAGDALGAGFGGDGAQCGPDSRGVDA